MHATETWLCFAHECEAPTLHQVPASGLHHPDFSRREPSAPLIDKPRIRKAVVAMLGWRHHSRVVVNPEEPADPREMFFRIHDEAVVGQVDERVVVESGPERVPFQFGVAPKSGTRPEVAAPPVLHTGGRNVSGIAKDVDEACSRPNVKDARQVSVDRRPEEWLVLLAMPPQQKFMHGICGFEVPDPMKSGVVVAAVACEAIIEFPG